MKWTNELKQRTEELLQEHATDILADLGLTHINCSLQVHYAPYVDTAQNSYTTGLFVKRIHRNGHVSFHIDIAAERDGQDVLDALAHEIRHMYQYVHGVEEKHLQLRILRQRALDSLENSPFSFFRKQMLEKAKYYNYYSHFEEVDARVYGAFYSKEGQGRGPRTLTMQELEARFPGADVIELEKMRVEAAELYCLTLEYNDYIVEKGE